MPVIPTTIMACACIIMFVMLVITIVSIIDTYKSLDKLKEIDKQLDKITETTISINKLKLALEEEVFKYKLIRETKEERKSGIFDDSNTTNVIHSNRNISNSSTSNSNTNNSNTYSREDSKNN